eukprot:5117372-Lingulodinium_polyedra.AAC.1
MGVLAWIGVAFLWRGSGVLILTVGVRACVRAAVSRRMRVRLVLEKRAATCSLRPKPWKLVA